MSNKDLSQKSYKELTLRGIILGGIITLIFTAANVYLGLKVGLTFATSIPAAVISMAILHKFAGHSIQENNIVQTIASAAGTLSAIIFVLPALIIIGYWNGFPYWELVAVCALGGILGVMYSVPLRRALVTGSDLRYPEGVAAAEVLKVGDSEAGNVENKKGMGIIIWGSLCSAGFMILTYLKLAAASVSKSFKIASSGTMVSGSLSLALVGVGHLVGIAVGIAMLTGLVLSYFVLLPIFANGALPADGWQGVLSSVWSGQVRLVGAGTMAVAAIWTLIKITGPIFKGMKEAAASARLRKEGKEVALVEQDIPIRYVGLSIMACFIPIVWLLWDFLQGTPFAQHAAGLVILGAVYLLLIGCVVASVCGYMAGLIGSSNSPISGVGILVVIIGSLLVKIFFGSQADAQTTIHLIAFTLFTASVIFGIATISNDNLQDLKTGQLVGATPWKQQLALVIGVVFGAAIIPPVMELMHTAFGFQGAPGAGPDALAAPQAGLMSILANGIFTNQLDWSRIGIGIGIGIAVIIVDEVLHRVPNKNLSLPALAVGMGLYLPMSSTLTIAIGALLGYFYDKWADKNPAKAEQKKRFGVLLATGLIVGEALIGVVYAAIIAASGAAEPLAIVGETFDTYGQIIGLVVVIAMLIVLYKKAAKSAEELA